MNQKQIRAAVEAMLFASGDPIGTDKLAQAVQLPQLSVEAALEALRERYAREDSGLCLLHLNTRWQLATKTEWADCIRRLLDSRRAVPLGPAAMETLTVIAYNQPVSRAFIEQVRGVDSSSSVSGLLEKGLIEEAGRLDLPGRPVAVHCMDGAYIGSYDVAVCKAYTAVAFQMSTAELGRLAAPGGPLYGIQNTNDGKIVIFGGGEPLFVDGVMIGAIGVSGGTAEQDTELGAYVKDIVKEVIDWK